jgi:long-chain acyl-CoA synthetase
MSDAPDFRNFEAELRQRARSWTQSAVFAREQPDGVALMSAQGQRSFAELHGNANRIASALRRRGLKPGDAVALMCRNRPEFIEVFLGALRSGLRLTPINTHLTAGEVAYVVADCGAQVMFVEAELAAGLGGAPAFAGAAAVVLIGDPSYTGLLADGDAGDLGDAAAGTLMLYTSGTTGRPKGVFRRAPEVIEPQFAGSFADYRPGDVALCAGPAYHAAPLLFDIRWPLASGVPIVLLEKWHSEQVLELIERHRVTHAHLVPLMLQRLLAVEAGVRAKADVSSLRFVVHGAAPCPIPVKRAIIDWFGPVVTEYYAATEGGNGIHINSADWLRKPGSVGRIDPSLGIRILDDAGQDVLPGRAGRIYCPAPPPAERFEYFGDAEKTANAYQGDHFTLGDIGVIDADGYLFLTGRAAECIISGGVNIYPREVDDVLTRHPAVAEVCTVGAPDNEWGERVVSVVVPRDGHSPSPALALELIAFAAEQLAGFKRPREIVFDTALPHTATGKLLRNQVRERFWLGRERAI